MGATPCRFESCPGHDGQLPDADVRRALARRAAPVSRARGADDARRVAGGGRPAAERREGPIVLLDAAVHRLPPAEPRPGPVPDGMDPRRAAYSGVTLVTILCQSYGNSGVHASRRTRV